MRCVIVSPRYGASLGGGAEMLARGLAQELHRQGHAVEVWTSTATNHYTWRNELPAGPSAIDGVPVTRFPIDRWDVDIRARVDTYLHTHRVLTMAQQLQWLESGPISSELCAQLAAQASSIDRIVALPYANPFVHAASWVAPARTILWPCLHDEPYAYLDLVRLLLESVWGVLFNTPEELQLAVDKVGVRLARSAVMGVGVDFEPPALESTFSVRKDLLYVGRLEGGKNVQLLYNYVRRLVAEGQDIRLTVAGSGPLQPPAHPAFRFAGYVDEPTKAALCASHLALVQPSENESFSIVAMEGWLCRTPALVNQACAVTSGHVQRSRGGLAYQGYADFAEAVRWLQDHPAQARRMGENGEKYVRANYTWPAIVRRFVETTATWQSSSAGGS